MSTLKISGNGIALLRVKLRRTKFVTKILGMIGLDN